jgi:chromosome partitioning protein
VAGVRTVALVAQKGGVGKSTLAVHVAACAARRGQSVALFDLDPQGSAVAWGERRATDDVKVVGARSQELSGLLGEAQEQGADLVVIDTAGRADTVAALVMGRADLVLVPCRPFIADLEASHATAEQVQRAGAGKRAAFVLNGAPSQGSRHVEAERALATLLPVVPVVLHHLVAFADAMNDGRSVEELEPEGRAAYEVRALVRWVEAEYTRIHVAKRGTHGHTARPA